MSVLRTSNKPAAVQPRLRGHCRSPPTRSIYPNRQAASCAFRHAGLKHALPIVLGVAAELEARDQPAHSLQGEPGLKSQYLGDFRAGTAQVAELCAGRGQKYARKSR